MRILSLGAGKPNWKYMTPEERFWIRVEKSDGCWLWTGATSSNGYGQIVVASKQMGAHCYAYELLIGPIAEGTEVDHTCHNADATCRVGQCEHRLCVRPDHLEAVAHPENVRRGKSWSMEQRRSGSCQYGHLMTEENRDPGHRRCRVCNRLEVSRRLRALRSHCPQGHVYDETNTRIDALGRRRCRTCFQFKDAS